MKKTLSLVIAAIASLCFSLSAHASARSEIVDTVRSFDNQLLSQEQAIQLIKMEHQKSNLNFEELELVRTFVDPQFRTTAQKDLSMILEQGKSEMDPRPKWELTKGQKWALGVAVILLGSHLALEANNKELVFEF